MTEPVQAVLGRLHGVQKIKKDQWQTLCPAHDDHKPSMSIRRGDDGKVLVHCHAGCTTTEVLSAIGLTEADLFPDSDGLPIGGTGDRRIVETYDYRAEGGELLFQVVRFEPKGFRQRRPDGKGDWLWNLNGVARVLYRLPELLAADRGEWVFVPEGEKDVDALATIDLIGTTNPGGAGKWRMLTDDSALDGRRVAILSDCDEPGRRHAQDVAARLHGKATEVRIVDLSGINGFQGKDVSDWLDWLDSREPDELAQALTEMAESASPWSGPAVDPHLVPVVVCLADVEPEEVRWLWPSRMALGKVSLLAGDPGLGKSLLTLDMAARVSTGRGWPDYPDALCGPAGVVLLSAEDDLSDTIRPRLDAASADVERIRALQAVDRIDRDTGEKHRDAFALKRDLAALEETVRQVSDCLLVVIDPISAYLSGVDSHRNAEVRSLLMPLSELAARYGVAIVVVTHLRKSEGPGVYRPMGSLAFIAAARAAYIVTRDNADESAQRRLMLPVKNNVGIDSTGLAYRLKLPSSEGGQPTVLWEEEPTTITVDEALHSGGSNGGDATPALNEAERWLRERLARGPQGAREVIADAQRDGISKRTLDRAKRRLGVTASKARFEGGWCWYLPGQHGQNAEGCHGASGQDLATFGKKRDLGDRTPGNALRGGAIHGEGGPDTEERQADVFGDLQEMPDENA